MPRAPARHDAARPATGPVSLADVAALAGVTAGTVSRVLSRPEMISEATRTRVLAAADRLGYVANGAARALAMRKTHTVGALVPRFGSSSFPTLVQALASTLAAAGYHLLLSALLLHLHLLRRPKALLLSSLGSCCRFLLLVATALLCLRSRILFPPQIVVALDKNRHFTACKARQRIAKRIGNWKNSVKT